MFCPLDFPSPLLLFTPPYPHTTSHFQFLVNHPPQHKHDETKTNDTKHRKATTSSSSRTPSLNSSASNGKRRRSRASAASIPNGSCGNPPSFPPGPGLGIGDFLMDYILSSFFFFWCLVDTILLSGGGGEGYSEFGSFKRGELEV